MSGCHTASVRQDGLKHLGRVLDADYLYAVIGKLQIPILYKNLKSIILKSQIQWPKSKSQI